MLDWLSKARLELSLEQLTPACSSYQPSLGITHYAEFEVIKKSALEGASRVNWSRVCYNLSNFFFFNFVISQKLS